MNRLFEALSNLEVGQPAPPAERLGAGSLVVIPTDVKTAETVAPQKEREPEADPAPLNVARLGTGVPEMLPQDVTVKEPVPPQQVEKANHSNESRPKTFSPLENRPVLVKASPESRLVAFTDPNCLGAEKFRALVARLDDMRKQGTLKSFQVTSSSMNEGKTVVAANVAVTLAKYSRNKTLLIEGDLHRSVLAELLGLGELRGVGDWWSGTQPELEKYVRRLGDMPLWFLPAGQFNDRPSDILSSTRFMKAFANLAQQFNWLVVDSTPMLPIVDVNLWSRLVDGTLLVVREGQTPVEALKKGLQALIRPKLIGVVMNDVSGSDQTRYSEQYSAVRKTASGPYNLSR